MELIIASFIVLGLYMAAEALYERNWYKNVYTDITFEKEGTKLLIRYTGNGFLYHMVRILTGTLIEIGLGERSPQEMKEILLKLDRQAAGFTAPPEGLFLERVMYEDRE